LVEAGHPGGQFAADYAGGGDDVGELGQQRTSACQQRLSGEGELHPLCGALEQVAADQPLQVADLPAQRGLRDVEAAGGAAEVELLGDRDERAQVPQLDRLRQWWQRQHGGVITHGLSLPRRGGFARCNPVMSLCRSSLSVGVSIAAMLHADSTPTSG
jgi:hypothetical protein